MPARTVIVPVERFRDGDFAGVCAMTGQPADVMIQVTATQQSPFGLLVLLFGGWIAYLLFAGSRPQVAGELPVVEAAHDAANRRLQRGVLAVQAGLVLLLITGAGIVATGDGRRRVGASRAGGARAPHRRPAGHRWSGGRPDVATGSPGQPVTRRGRGSDRARAPRVRALAPH